MVKDTVVIMALVDKRDRIVIGATAICQANLIANHILCRTIAIYYPGY